MNERLNIKVSWGNVVVEVNGIPTTNERNHEGQNGRFRSEEGFDAKAIESIIVATLNTIFTGKATWQP